MSERIKLEDTTMSAVIKLVDGNPGAMDFCMRCLTPESQKIDPQNIMGGMGVLLSLDTLGLYGTDIYVLYNDKCNRDMRQMLMLLRGHQLGFISTEKIVAMGKDQMRQINLTDEEWMDLEKKVCKQLEQFQNKRRQNASEEN